MARKQKRSPRETQLLELVQLVQAELGLIPSGSVDHKIFCRAGQIGEGVANKLKDWGYLQ